MLIDLEAFKRRHNLETLEQIDRLLCQIASYEAKDAVSRALFAEEFPDEEYEVDHGSVYDEYRYGALRLIQELNDEEAY